MMKEHKRKTTGYHRERAVLVGLILSHSAADREHPLEELAGLAETARAEVVGSVTQRAKHFNAATYVGKGKAEDVRREVAATDADLVICDHDLSASQVRNLEGVLETKVIDRSELILDIFAQHARSNQSKLQVELAQLEYMMPRLIGMWSHFERPEGAIGTRGPGETQLETDRRLVRTRIAHLKSQLMKIQRRKERQVASRTTYTVSLVGYTNAGKSTLLNALTGSNALVADQLFATLDTKSVRWEVEKNRHAVLSDTVGFIRRLPHHLVASFHATLEEALQADLLLHVADASHPHCEEQMQSVDEVLAKMGCADRPLLTVLNKIDAVADPGDLVVLRDGHPDHVLVSAARGDGLRDICEHVASQMSGRFAEVRVKAGLTDGKLIAFMRGHAQVVNETQDDETLHIAALIERNLLGRLKSLTKSVEVAGEEVSSS
jgi:GTPase